MRRAGPPWGEQLRQAYGEPRRVRRLSASPRSRVWRVELGTGSAVVKQAVGDGAEARFRRELTALSLAAMSGSDVVPGLLGSNESDLVLVLRDGGPTRLDGDWGTAWATGLAGLHAAGRSVAAAAEPAALPRAAGPGRADVEAFLRLAAALGADVGPDAEGELDGVVARLTASREGGRALLHGDPCPDNVVVSDGVLRFVDLEGAALGDGLVELAYLRIGFPTCWCTVGLAEAAVDRAEAAYRTTWARLTDAPPEGDLVDACIGWVLRGDALVEAALRDGTDHLARLVQADWRWGASSARERLAHRLGVVAALAQREPRPAATARLTATLRDRILARWPDVRPVPTTLPRSLTTG